MFQIPATEDMKFREASQPQIQIESWSNAARTVEVRGFTRHGTFSFDHATNADRTRAVDTFALPDFPIFLQASPSTAPVRRGELYVRISLLLAGFSVGRLSAGYLTDSKTITWPPGVHEDSTSGRGLLRVISGTNPAAGNEVIEIVPTNARWRLLSLGVGFVTDATVASRQVRLRITDGTQEIALVPATASQAESTTRSYWFVAGYPNTPGLQSGVVYSFIPTDYFIPQGGTIETKTANLQAGDNYGTPILVVEEWIEE